MSGFDSTAFDNTGFYTGTGGGPVFAPRVTGTGTGRSDGTGIIRASGRTFSRSFRGRR